MMINKFIRHTGRTQYTRTVTERQTD